MRCTNCNKEIDNDEVICDECKKKLKENSSRRELNEFEKLVEENKKLNDLDDTKELDNLEDLIYEEGKPKVNQLNITREEKNEQNYQVAEFQEEIKTDEIKPKQNKNKKKIIIIISIICTLLILTICLFLIFKPKKSVEVEEKIDYKKIINEYGKIVENSVSAYINSNNSVPKWIDIVDSINYKKYNVSCDIHDIYDDGNIYLNNCKIDSVSVKYFYGQEQEIKNEGKKIQIYKLNQGENYYTYSDSEEKNSKLIGTITCQTSDCIFIQGYDKYVVIKEENDYYLYNYESDGVVFGPFVMKDEYSYPNHVLSYNNKVYGIYYENNGGNIYNVNTGKVLKNLKGTILFDDMSVKPSLLLKYNYVIMNYNGAHNFINLKTGNISYTISDNIREFIDDDNNNIAYITTYKKDFDSFKIYNSNGKLLFDGKEYSDMELANGSIIVSNNNQYWVYDSSLKLKTNSKKYEKILKLYSDFIVVIDDTHLKLVDTNDKSLALFDIVWDDNKYYFHSILSGWHTENGKQGIYLVVENKDIPLGTKGSCLKYYYIPSTKETGVIETNSVSG